MLNNIAKPILKWAGGKTQMLGDLLPKVPKSYGRYIEPFFGGGAMFEADKAQLEHLRDLIFTCETRRDILEAPAWKQYIDTMVSENGTQLC